MHNVDLQVWRGDMSGNLANVIGLEDHKPFLLAITPKENRWDFIGGAIRLGLPHPFFGFNLLATLALYVKRKVLANHIAGTAFWITRILLGASGLLPSLFAQIICQFPLARRALTS